MTTPPNPPPEHNRPVVAGVDTATVQPPSNAGWAVAAALFFWPLSFAACTHAFDVYPLWASGDIQGARDASDRVRRLGQLSLWIAGGLLLVLIVVYTIVAVILIAQGDLEPGGHVMEHDGLAR